jgi:alkaline phosphatase D
MRDFHWFDLFQARGSRRDFLRTGSHAAALVALGSIPACRDQTGVRLRDEPFTLGVASGDPLPHGVVLWTRLAREALLQTAGADAGVPVRWEVAEDDGFRRLARSGQVLALPELGYSVHAEVEGLEPDRVYYYRFLSGGAPSPTGRTRTAPEQGARSDRLRFAFASCQQYEDGYYTAYRHMADEDLDLVVHLGDYIYENGGGDSMVRPHDGGEIFSLDDYRRRYIQYRSDPNLQAAHSAFPWVVVWDDHEVDDNYANGVPQDGQPPEAFLLRRAAAYQAYYEFMPLRRSAMPRGPDIRLYRRLAFGDLVTMAALDTRQYRDDQACGDGSKRSCDEHRDPGRTLLGAEQERWLLEGLQGSRARWNVVAQQVMMAGLIRHDDEGEPLYLMDMWDGYPAARRRVLDAFGSGGVANPVVLTGDVHSSWVADLKADIRDPGSSVVGTELVGTSISSGGDGQEAFPGFDRTQAGNPHIHFHSARRGYVRVDVAPERLTARFRAVPWVTQPGAPLETKATYVVESGRAGAQRSG